MEHLPLLWINALKILMQQALLPVKDIKNPMLDKNHFA
jgi:hypothetical protein